MFLLYGIYEHKTKVLELIKYVEKIEKYESVMHPYFNLNFRGRLLPEIIADFSVRTDDLERTKKYYEMAIDYNPYNVHLLLKHAEFLFNDMNAPAQAKSYTAKALKLHPNYYKSLILHAEILLTEKQSNMADFNLDVLEDIQAKIEKMGDTDRKMNAKKQKNISKRMKIVDEIEKLKSEVRKKKSTKKESG